MKDIAIQSGLVLNVIVLLWGWFTGIKSVIPKPGATSSAIAIVVTTIMTVWLLWALWEIWP
jgi:hypothetical protein